MKFQDLNAVVVLTESPSVAGVWFKNISFDKVAEFQAHLDQMAKREDSEENSSEDDLNAIADVTFWLFENVFRDQDESKFEDIHSVEDVKRHVPVIIVRKLFDDAIDLLIGDGGSKQGNDLETIPGDS